MAEYEIIRDHATNRSRGFGFIVFDAEKTVDELLAKKGNMIDLNGSQVRFHVVLPELRSFVQLGLHTAINCGTLVVSSVFVALVALLYEWRVISTPFLEVKPFERKYRLTFLLCCRWRSRRQNQRNPLTHHLDQLIVNLGAVHMRKVMMDLAAPITMVVVLAPIDHLEVLVLGLAATVVLMVLLIMVVAMVHMVEH